MNQYIMSLIIGLFVAMTSGSFAQVPTMMTYQGHIQSDGTNFNGLGEFKFALVDVSGASTYWSNDDSSLDGSEPILEVLVPVEDGMFSVALGDPSLENMTEVPVSVFTNPAVHLRLWFSDGENDFEQLTPDQAIHSVGYAMMSADVPDDAITGAKIAPASIGRTHVIDGGITTTELADESVTTPKLADGAVTAEKIAEDAISSDQIVDEAISTDELADGSVTTPKLADDAVTAAKIAPNAVSSSQIVNNAVTSSDVADTLTLETLELGGMSWDGSLQLFSQPTGGGIAIPGGTPRGYLEADAFGSEMALYMSEGQTGIELSSRSPGGRMRLWDASETMTAYLGTTLGGGDLNLFQIDGNLGVSLNGDRATYNHRNSEGGEITVHGRGGGTGLLLDGAHNSAGRIEVRQPAKEQVYVDIFGRGRYDGGEIRVKDSGAGDAVVILGEIGDADGRATNRAGGGQGGQIELYQADTDIGAILYGAAPNNGAGGISLRNLSGDPRLRLFGGPSSGSIQLLNDEGLNNIYARSWDGEEGVVSIYNKNGAETVYLWGRDSADVDGGQIGLKTANGTETLTMQASEIAGQGAQIALSDGDGVARIILDADHDGEGRIITQVLEITGGSDLSEQFEIGAIDRPPEPGMLVCIDPNEPGQLALSTQAYDRTAAGVISGAGGVKPGMLMGQAGTIADGQYPVALTGRVYCQVDAHYGSIQPGDLITTSNTPGLGMKVTDYSRAQGAIIGKAMTRLESGRGMVLVLVSLQ